MKRLLALLLCLVMALSLIPAAAAEDIEIVDVEPEVVFVEIVEPETPADPENAVPNSITGEYFGRADWELDDHTLYLKCRKWADGDIINYVMFQEQRPWDQYIDEIQTIVLDEGCIRIDDYAFQDYPNLTSITIPSSVTIIKKGAFKDCPKLQNVTLPYIGKIFEGTFEGTAISSLRIPSSVTVLEDYALGYMSELRTVTFLGGLPEIGANAFKDVTATVYTPTGSDAWPESAMKDYGGHLTWANIPKPVITTQPKNVTDAKYGETVTLSVEATGSYLSYQWQYGRTRWMDIPADKGGTSASYSFTIGANEDGSYTGASKYRCVVSNKGGSVTSEVASVTVDQKPVITASPKSASAMAGNTVTFTVGSVGPDRSYQWYYRTSSSGSWAKSSLSGNKTATLSVKATEARNGYQYYCKVSNSAGTTYSKKATLTVCTKPSITTQPSSKSIKEGETAKFTVAATGGSLKYQWYYRTSSTGSWQKSTATGATTKTLTVVAKGYRDGYQYYCKVTNAAGTVYSKKATLTVLTKPAITTQPADKTASAGATVKFTVKATGGDLKYQWYYRTSSNGEWKKCTGTGYNTATLSVEAKSFRSGYQYCCKVSNSMGTVYSKKATLTVK